MTRPDPDGLVCVAAVAAPHGVRGALKLRCFTAEPEGVAAYGPLLDEAGRRLFAVTILGSAAGGVIARAEGVASRDAAEALRGTRLYVPRARLPALEEDEFYHADLLGMEAVTPEGAVLGRIAAVHDFGAGDVIEIAGEAGRSTVLPFTRAVVPVVDLARRRLTVVPPAETLVPAQGVAGAPP